MIQQEENFMAIRCIGSLMTSMVKQSCFLILVQPSQGQINLIGVPAFLYSLSSSIRPALANSASTKLNSNLLNTPPP